MSLEDIFQISFPPVRNNRNPRVRRNPYTRPSEINDVVLSEDGTLDLLRLGQYKYNNNPDSDIEMSDDESTTAKSSSKKKTTNIIQGKEREWGL